MKPYDIINNELDVDLRVWADDNNIALLFQIQQLRATRQLSKDIQYLIKEVGSFRIEQAKAEVSGDTVQLHSLHSDLLAELHSDLVSTKGAPKKIPSAILPDGSIRHAKGKVPKSYSAIRRPDRCTCSPGYHSDKCPVHGRRTG